MRGTAIFRLPSLQSGGILTHHWRDMREQRLVPAMKAVFVRDLLCSEIQKSTRSHRGFRDALPRTVRSLSSPRFQQGVRELYRSASNQLERMHVVTDRMRISYNGESCPLMDVLVAELDRIISGRDAARSESVDAQVACLLRKASHYLIASHRRPLVCSRLLKLKAVEAILTEALEQDLETDSHIAEMTTWVLGMDRSENQDEALDRDIPILAERRDDLINELLVNSAA
jgi:ferritin-like metal-binding protein YciE